MPKSSKILLLKFNKFALNQSARRFQRDKIHKNAKSIITKF